MHFLFATMGTREYVLPFFSIAARLKAQGHRTTIITEYGYADIADYISLSTADEHKKVARDRRQLLHTRYDLLFLKRHTVAWNRLILEKIREHLADDLVVVSADRNTMWADLEAHRRWSVKVVRAAVDLPKRTTDRPPATPVQTRLLRESEDLWDQQVESLGIQPDRHSIFDMYRRVRPLASGIALWPQWMVPESKVRAFGFMPPPTPAQTTSKDFGELVFIAGTEGSLRGWLPRFLDVCSEACVSLGLKGTVLGAGNEGSSRPMLESIGFAHLPDVLAHARAVVHHGGIGTIAAALESGVPQLAIPRVAGQHSNAEWLRRLGLCRVIRPDEWTARSSAPILQTVMSDFCKESAHRATRLVDREASLAAVCNFLSTSSRVSGSEFARLSWATPTV